MKIVCFAKYLFQQKEEIVDCTVVQFADMIIGVLGIKDTKIPRWL